MHKPVARFRRDQHGRHRVWGWPINSVRIAIIVAGRPSTGHSRQRRSHSNAQRTLTRPEVQAMSISPATHVTARSPLRARHGSQAWVRNPR